jgi:hypothetical protein
MRPAESLSYFMYQSQNCQTDVLTIPKAVDEFLINNRAPTLDKATTRQ